MSVLLFLIPITLILGLLGLAAFLWCIKSKQYDDLEGAANRILFEESEKISEVSPNKKNEKSKK